MKKKFIVSILTAVITAAMLGGCGKGSAETPENENAAAESMEENDKEETPEMEAEAEPDEGAEETEEPEASAAEETDWLEDQGLSITPQGEFTLRYLVYNPFCAPGETEIMGEESETANITVTETIENGCKKIEAVLTCDFAGLEKYDNGACAYGIFCFDRYTGIAMRQRVGDIAYYTAMEESMDENRGNEISEENLAIYYNMYRNDDIKMTVFCPEDYDGAVFGVQCYSFENEELYNYNDATGGSSHIGDESGLEVGPYLGGDSILFSASNE